MVVKANHRAVEHCKCKIYMKIIKTKMKFLYLLDIYAFIENLIRQYCKNDK